jgi:hypothetical protein
MDIYRIYIDESGDHTYYLNSKEPAKIYLGITGVIIKQEYNRTRFHPELEAFKQKHFPHNPDEPVILHRKDIINRIGPFWRLRNRERDEAFREDLLKLFKDLEYCLITVVIDKNNHIRRYGKTAYNPYHYCLMTMIERYCGFLKYHNAQGDVMAESRGKSEDRLLKAAYKSIYYDGTFYHSSEFFQNRLTSHEIKLKPKIKNISGLQFADLLAYPSKQEILIEYQRCSKYPEGSFTNMICDAIQFKYNRQIYQGRTIGYGKKFLPQ